MWRRERERETEIERERKARQFGLFRKLNSTTLWQTNKMIDILCTISIDELIIIGNNINNNNCDY